MKTIQSYKKEINLVHQTLFASGFAVIAANAQGMTFPWAAGILVPVMAIDLLNLGLGYTESKKEGAAKLKDIWPQLMMALVGGFTIVNFLLAFKGPLLWNPEANPYIFAGLLSVLWIKSLCDLYQSPDKAKGLHTLQTGVLLAGVVSVFVCHDEDIALGLILCVSAILLGGMQWGLSTKEKENDYSAVQ
jgi:hypothetical protein